MRNRLLLTGVLLIAGCSDRARSSAPDRAALDTALGAEQSLALEQLEHETGAPWAIASNARLGTPSMLAVRSAIDPQGEGALSARRPMLGAGESAARATVRFLATNKALFRMEDPERELAIVNETKDELGMTHARFEQRVGGLRVSGAELIAHYGALGELTSIRARYVPGLASMDLNATFPVSRAIDSAAAEVAADPRHADVDAPTLARASSAELVVFVDDEGRASLAYRVHVRGEATVRMEYAIDARTGEVLQKYDDIQTVAGSGAGVLGDTKTLQVSAGASGFTLTDTSRTARGITTYTADTGTTTPGTLVASTSATSWDATGIAKGAAVDAHFYAGLVYDYYKTAHGRKGIDGVDGAIISTVHFQKAYDNAFWDGTQMVYGDGDGTNYRAFSGAVDVIAHELTHGVTQSTSNLEYVNQSGALNEAVSDIFGTFVEHSFKDDPKTNWILGEAISVTNTPIRDMIHPTKQQQPANMSQFVKTTQDNGGVHINSGIVNNAMFLMTNGGKNDVSGKAVSQGLGWEKSAQLWYRAAFHYFGATTDFAGAAQDTLLAAADLKFSENEKNIVECAWIATGVVSGTCETLVAEPVDAGTPEVPPTPRTDNGATSAVDAGASNGATDVPKAAAAPRRSLAPTTQGCAVSVSGVDASSSAAAMWLLGAVAAVLRIRRRSR